MAKKPDFNQSAEIRSILQGLGKEAEFKEVFEELRARHKGYTFNKDACQQALSVARKKLGFANGPRPKQKPAAKPKAAMAARVIPAGDAAPTTVAARVVRAATAVTKTARTGDGMVVDAITTAQKLIADCGGKEAAKHVIDNVT